MKRILLSFALCSLFIVGFGRPKISNLSYPNTVDLLACYEIAFEMGPYDNPYDPDVIRVYADFIGPDKQTYTVEAFYFEGYGFNKSEKCEVAVPNREKGWRIRFTPVVSGPWSFTIHALDRSGETVLSSWDAAPLAFQCRPVASAQGFITQANTMFLKRKVVSGGKLQDRSFFPVGPNIAWYDCADYNKYTKPYGIYDYERYIDSLSGNANYMRIWLNRYQFMSLYGPEHTQFVNGKPVMYFDATLNQKDAAELDHIMEYAALHGVTIMPCIFNYRNFQTKSSVAKLPSSVMPSDWINNPFHTVLGLGSNAEFFKNPEAIRISKNLVRYIVSRWGYATNIVCWELWNECNNMFDADPDRKVQQDIIRWHEEMAAYVRSLDPYHRPLTTSLGKMLDPLYRGVFESLDIVQNHNYQNIHKAKSKEQFTQVLLQASQNARLVFPDQLFFMGEFAFGQSKPGHSYEEKDPHGIDIHNSLWSSLFSGSMGPASFWFWDFLKKADLFRCFKPVKTFCEQLPPLSDSFVPKTTGVAVRHSMLYPNNLATYYMINASEDTIMGWSQDTAFCYQSLRRLADPVGKDGHFVNQTVNDPQAYVYTLKESKKPRPSSRRNTITIPITMQRRGTRYVVKWFDAETGLEMKDEATEAVVRTAFLFRRVLSFEFPSSVRDLRASRVNNTLGDAVFVLYRIQD